MKMLCRCAGVKSALLTVLIRCLIVVLPMLVLGACTAQKQTYDDMERLREERVGAASQVYPAVNRKDVIKAIISTFQTIDSDVDFDFRKDRVLVARNWTYYAVFSVGWGKDYWEILVEDTPEGVRLTSAYTSESNHGPFASRVTTPFKENIGIGGNVVDGASVADYHLLYSRISYFLGHATEWVTCDDAKKQHGNRSGNLILCERIGIEESRPR